MKRGALYICYGDKYIQEGIISAESLKKFHPDLHITFLSDKAFLSKFVDNVEIIKPKAKRPKVEHIKQSPYEETLFLDVDTVIDSPIDDIFKLLSKFDMAICDDTCRKRPKYSKIMTEYKNIPYGFSELNTGVICFKKTESIDNLFSLWRAYYKKYNNKCPWDQPSFRISLWESDVKFHVLPREYNVRSKQNKLKNKGFLHDPKVYHMHHGENNLNSALDYCKLNFSTH